MRRTLRVAAWLQLIVASTGHWRWDGSSTIAPEGEDERRPAEIGTEFELNPSGLGYVHIPKTGGTAMEALIGPACGLNGWGIHNLQLFTHRLIAPESGASNFCESGFVETTGSIWAEHVPPVFWVNQYDDYDPYKGYTELFTHVRNPYTRAVSAFKHFSGTMFNQSNVKDTPDPPGQAYGRTSPAAAKMSWPADEACDPRHINEWLETYLRDAKPTIELIEKQQELPPGGPCDPDTVCGKVHPDAQKTLLDPGFQNMIPQWLYVSPTSSAHAPLGYPVRSRIPFEDANGGFHRMLNVMFGLLSPPSAANETRPDQANETLPAQDPEVAAPNGTFPVQDPEVAAPNGTLPAQDPEVAAPNGTLPAQDPEVAAPKGILPAQDTEAADISYQLSCLQRIDTDAPEYQTQNTPYGEPLCSTTALTNALNPTVVALIREIFARDFAVLGYSTDIDRAFEPPHRAIVGPRPGPAGTRRARGRHTTRKT
jgi:hypothetical protein